MFDAISGSDPDPATCHGVLCNNGRRCDPGVPTLVWHFFGEKRTRDEFFNVGEIKTRSQE